MTRQLRAALSCALLAVAVVTPLHARQSRAVADTSVDAIVERAAEYVKSYRQELTYVMATERSVQKLRAGLPIYDVEETLASDVYFVYVPSDKVWMAIRDVEVADGKTLKERENVRAILDSGKAGAARELKEKNARYNLGSIVRNFNEPTLALLVLDDDHRSRVTFVKQKTSGSRVVVSFVERMPPTLISNVDGTPARSKGEFTIDAATGRIEASTLSVRLGKVDATLTTTYRSDAKLGIWVPARFDELYVEDSKRGERVTGQSLYSDYTRFDVQVRIK